MVRNARLDPFGDRFRYGLEEERPEFNCLHPERLRQGLAPADRQPAVEADRRAISMINIEGGGGDPVRNDGDRGDGFCGRKNFRQRDVGAVVCLVHLLGDVSGR